MQTGIAKEIVNILSRSTGAVVFSAEIECKPDELPSTKLGLAVKVAVKSRAYLSRADLAGANLAGANLADANLADANLADANLADANLARANLARADLAGANLAGANLADAYLADANLARANLSGANLSGANLSGAKNADYAIAQTRILPEGDLIGWKKLYGGTIAKLRIPAEARRSHAFGRKCRAEFVDVIEGEGISSHDRKTTYAPGSRVTCDKWDENWQEECAGGIHFFITRIEAENY